MDFVTWRKARRSNDQGGEYVEVAEPLGDIAVRDSKDPGGPGLVLDRTAFRALLVGIKAS